MTEFEAWPPDAESLFNAVMKTSILLIAAAILVAGCSPSQTVWHREGATDDELKLVQRDCARQAQNYGFVFESGRNGDDLTGGERRAGSAGGAVYRDCMERRGWRRLRDTSPS